MKVLVTGGAGYIGSHTVVALVEAGHEVVVLDNFANSSPEAIRRVSDLTGVAIPVAEADVRDRFALEEVFAAHRPGAVVHFAGLKSVAESVAEPLAYYDANVTGAITLLEAAGAHGVRTFVFSSSATVYGADASVPYREDTPTGLGIANPYGQTKHQVETILRDLAASDPSWRITVLRYFNPIGAHPSGLIGEDPEGMPNNLLPYVAQVAVGALPEVRVFGDDYPTPDGTGVRDYIHVMDLADGHVSALAGSERPYRVYNLGTGRGSSVLEVVRAFEEACGHPVPHRVVPRRDGDLAAYWADPALAEAELGWTATRDLDEACRDAWNWQSRNPAGYR